MKIDVLASGVEIALVELQGSAAVVIDVLRATSVITTAMAHTAKAFYPVVEVSEAWELGASLQAQYPGERVLRSGERSALLIPGFDLANSPLEFTPDRVGAAHIVMTTSNGTRALQGAKQAEPIYVGSLLNAVAVAHAIKNLKQVFLVCSGTADRLDISDCMAAGAIIRTLQEEGCSLELSDLAMICAAYYDPLTCEERIRASLHGQRLMALGLDEDIRYCCQTGIFDVVPRYDGVRIRA